MLCPPAYQQNRPPATERLSSEGAGTHGSHLHVSTPEILLAFSGLGAGRWKDGPPPGSLSLQGPLQYTGGHPDSGCRQEAELRATWLQACMPLWACSSEPSSFGKSGGKEPGRQPKPETALAPQMGLVGAQGDLSPFSPGTHDVGGEASGSQASLVSSCLAISLKWLEDSAPFPWVELCLALLTSHWGLASTCRVPGMGQQEAEPMQAEGTRPPGQKGAESRGVTVGLGSTTPGLLRWEGPACLRTCQQRPWLSHQCGAQGRRRGRSPVCVGATSTCC